MRRCRLAGQRRSVSGQHVRASALRKGSLVRAPDGLTPKEGARETPWLTLEYNVS